MNVVAQSCNVEGLVETVCQWGHPKVRRVVWNMQDTPPLPTPSGCFARAMLCTCLGQDPV